MKYFLPLFFSFFCLADLTPLPEVRTNLVKKSDVNRLHRALSFDIVPRNSAGNAEASAGSLGTSSFVWEDLFIAPSFNLRDQLGAIANSSSQNMNLTNFSGTSYASGLASTVSITTTGKPLLFWGAPQTGTESSNSYIMVDDSGQVNCTSNFRILMDGTTTLLEQGIGWVAQVTPVSTMAVTWPTTIVWGVYNTTLSAGVHTFDLQFKVATNTCDITTVNGAFYVMEI